MPKIKTKKTLMKRIKISKSGNIMRRQVGIGHLKSKWSTSKRFRKLKNSIQENVGHRKIIKRLLGSHSKGVK